MFCLLGFLFSLCIQDHFMGVDIMHTMPRYVGHRSLVPSLLLVVCLLIIEPNADLLSDFNLLALVAPKNIMKKLLALA